MCYNGLNNMFFPLCLINDNHSVTSPSHTKKTKSDNYRKHHKSTLIDNKALSEGFWCRHNSGENEFI